MSYEYSENELVQNSAIELLRDTLGWRTFYAYNDEVLGNASSSKSLGRSSYKEILLTRYLKEAVFKFNNSHIAMIERNFSSPKQPEFFIVEK